LILAFEITGILVQIATSSAGLLDQEQQAKQAHSLVYTQPLGGLTR
jgi:hypothetical protein